MTDASRSMRLGRRGFCAAVEHPVERTAQRRRARSTEAIATGILVVISLAELTWILVR